MIAGYVLHTEIKEGAHYGPGSVLIIPAVQDCGCSHDCVAMDEARATVKCVCPPGAWILSSDGRNCVRMYHFESDTFEFRFRF